MSTFAAFLASQKRRFPNEYYTETVIKTGHICGGTNIFFKDYDVAVE